ncbi:MAG: D-alanine-D-alanine ligase-like protein [Ignavibacteria bacterium]|nr:MAG: D-alanine-D-alanine ligase-like protein [Ignavibacteria bacterium]KAF0160379.1 MAG: D-alanine-D-alanine ligase-like protein [Ignavibacteria bacterium]
MILLDHKILICYNEPTRYYTNYLGKEVEGHNEDNDLSEREFLNQIESIKNLLKKRYSFVGTLAINRNVRDAIKKIVSISPDVIFNFVESVEGNSDYESYIAGVFDLLEIQYTGNSAMTLGNCLQKYRTKQILKANGVKTPEYYLAQLGEVPSINKFRLNFPVILKLAREDASIGISEFSVVFCYEDLRARLNYLFTSYSQEVIIEEYIEGRELNVAILGGQVLPISEITFDTLPSGLPKIVTYEAKWSSESVYFKSTVPKCPAKLDERLEKKIVKMALEAYDALDCRDYVRVDIRLNKKNIPYVIEVNPNPDISPDTGFVRSALAAGICYEELLYKISSFALLRNSYDTQAAS